MKTLNDTGNSSLMQELPLVQVNVDVLNNYNNLVTESLNRYFKLLEYTGYVNNNQVYQLIMLDIIGDIFDNYKEYITDEDMQLFSSLLPCLTNNCLIPNDIKITSINCTSK